MATGSTCVQIQGEIIARNSRRTGARASVVMGSVEEHQEAIAGDAATRFRLLVEDLTSLRILKKDAPLKGLS